jgi:uncharacterized membrane protein YeiH
MYFAELIGIALFAATGVLAVSRRGLDVIGAVMLGLVTALGGGTLRDLLMRYPIFWFENLDYFWAAVVGGLVTFFATTMFQNAQRSLLYLDALGAALFTIAAANKVLVDPRLSATLAVMLGVLTGIGGGLLRDVLAGRQTLLMSRDIYATPILIGCTMFVLLRELAPGFPYAGITSAAVIFTLRALAIWFHLQMPAWLVK